jgi:hypothetical protein
VNSLNTTISINQSISFRESVGINLWTSLMATL